MEGCHLGCRHLTTKRILAELRALCPEGMLPLRIYWMHHLLAVSLLLLGIF